MIAELIQLLLKGGIFAQVAAGLGALAFVLGLAVLFGARLGTRSGILRALSFACLLFAILSTTTAAFSTFQGRSATDAAADKMKPRAAERIRYQGWSEARSALTLALPLSGPPALFALIGFLVASRRRWTEFHEAPPTGPGLSFLLLLLAVGSWAGGAYLWKQPIPGRELDAESWQVLDLTDALDSGEWDKCVSTAWSLKAGSPAQQLGAHADNQRRCIEHFAADKDALPQLEKLAALGWIDDATQKEDLKKKIAALHAPAPLPPGAAAPPSADPAIAELQDVWKKCLEVAAKKQPKLEVAAVMLVNVAKTGKVMAAKDKAGGKLDNKVRTCAVAAAKKAKLPAGDDRTVEVPLVWPAK